MGTSISAASPERGGRKKLSVHNAVGDKTVSTTQAHQCMQPVQFEASIQEINGKNERKRTDIRLKSLLYPLVLHSEGD